MSGFDETRLDDERALAGADAALRSLAESGARLRRAVAEVAEDAAVGRELAAELDRPRAILVAGAEADLVRTVIEPLGATPVVSWRAAELPRWVGGLDLVVVLAPAGAPDATAAGWAATAVRRGCRVVAVCAPGSPVADHAAGRWSTVLRTPAAEPVTTALVALHHLGVVSLGPSVDPDEIADAHDALAVSCTPYRDALANPAKQAALGLADTGPLVAAAAPSDLGSWAARRAADAMRRVTGLPVLAGDADSLLPVLEAAPPRSVFDDPHDPSVGARRPSLLLLSTPTESAGAAPDAAALRDAAERHGVRVVELGATRDAVPEESPLPAHVVGVVEAAWTATYLRLATVTG